MSHEDLDRALSGLPREHARPEFTRRVLERIGQAPASRPARTPRWAWAAAAALVVVAIAAIGGTRWQAGERTRAARIELAEFQAEHQRLAAELAALRRAPRPQASMLLVGGDDRGEIVIDLERLVPPSGIESPVRRTSGAPGR